MFRWGCDVSFISERADTCSQSPQDAPPSSSPPKPSSHFQEILKWRTHRFIPSISNPTILQKRKQRRRQYDTILKEWYNHPHLMSKRHVSTSARPPRIPRILIPIDDDLGYLPVLAEVFRLPQGLLDGYARGHAHGVHQVTSDHAHGREGRTILGRLRRTLAAGVAQGRER